MSEKGNEFLERVAGLEAWHREALMWFYDRAGGVTGWPEPFLHGAVQVFLASKPKGIYKPSGSKFALSVRQGIASSYADLEPVRRTDGTWSYLYFQENPDPAKRDQYFTNLGLMECLNAKVPVGVLRQIAKEPQAKYEVLGVAQVVDWKDGYFFLEGYNARGMTGARSAESQFRILESLQKAKAALNFDPESEFDARERVVASIVRRRGQPRFRAQLLEAYEGRCSVSGCGIEPVLEAAHISPYLGPHTNTVTNGLLLRADLHTLFDLGLLAVDSKAMSVVIAEKLSESEYSQLKGKPLLLPKEAHWLPSAKALELHRAWANI